VLRLRRWGETRPREAGKGKELGEVMKKLFSTILLQIACEKRLVERYEFASEAYNHEAGESE